MDTAFQVHEPWEDTTIRIRRVGQRTVVESETITSIDQAADQYLKAPPKSKQRAEALEKYRFLTGGSKLFHQTPQGR